MEVVPKLATSSSSTHMSTYASIHMSPTHVYCDRCIVFLPHPSFEKKFRRVEGLWESLTLSQPAVGLSPIGVGTSEGLKQPPTNLEETYPIATTNRMTVRSSVLRRCGLRQNAQLFCTLSTSVYQSGKHFNQNPQNQEKLLKMESRVAMEVLVLRFAATGSPGVVKNCPISICGCMPPPSGCGRRDFTLTFSADVAMLSRIF